MAKQLLVGITDCGEYIFIFGEPDDYNADNEEYPNTIFYKRQKGVYCEECDKTGHRDGWIEIGPSAQSLMWFCDSCFFKNYKNPQ